MSPSKVIHKLLKEHKFVSILGIQAHLLVNSGDRISHRVIKRIVHDMRTKEGISIGIRTTHPNGTTYEYLPEFTSINWMGKKVVHRLRREPAVFITYPDGTTRFIWNSFYD